MGNWDTGSENAKRDRCSSTASSSSATGPVKEVHIVGQEEDWQDFSEADYLRMFHEVDEQLTGDYDEQEVNVVDVRSSLDVMLDTNHCEANQKALSSDHSGARTVESSREVNYVGPCTDRSGVFEALSSENRAEQDQEASGQYDADLERHGVPDTACRRSLIGEQVLKRMERYVMREGNKVIRRPCNMTFKFGNAGNLISKEIALVPCSIAGRRIVLQLAVLPGTGSETPLLMSKELLRTLGVVMDMSTDSMQFKNLGVTVRLKVTRKGHYAVPLFQEVGDVMVSECKHTTQHTVRTAIGDQISAEDSLGTRGEKSSHATQSAQRRQPCPVEPDEAWSSGGSIDSADHFDTGSAAGCSRRHSTPVRSSWIDGDAGREVQGQGRPGGLDYVRGLCQPEELHPMCPKSHRTRVRSRHAGFETVCGVEGPQQDPEDPAGERCTQSGATDSLDPSDPTSDDGTIGDTSRVRLGAV